MALFWRIMSTQNRRPPPGFRAIKIGDAYGAELSTARSLALASGRQSLPSIWAAMSYTLNVPTYRRCGRGERTTASML
jgi:hypothetical protein